MPFLRQKKHKKYSLLALAATALSFCIAMGCVSANATSSMGVNLDFPGDWSKDYPFIDLMKNSRNWIVECEGAETSCFPNNIQPEDDGVSWIDLDERGWPKSMQSKADPTITFGGISTIFLTLEEDDRPADRLVVLYEGEGILDYRLAAQKNERLSQPGRDILDLDPQGEYAYLIIRATDPNKTGNYLRNIRIIPEQLVDEYEAGETIFHPDFLAYIQNFKSLRFMDWMQTNSSVEKEWEDRPQPDNQISYLNHYIPQKGKVTGYPIEVMVALANRANANPWFSIPHQATDEYITEFAKLVKDSLDPTLKVQIEYSNEVWNWGFPQATYALESANQRWGKDESGEDYGDGYMQFHGMKTAQMCDIWKQVFGEDRERVICVLGVHTGWKGLEQSALDCPLYVAEGHKPCWQNGIDVLGVTGYFSGLLQEEENEDTIASWLSNSDSNYAFDRAFQQLEIGGVEGIKRDDNGSSDSVEDAIQAFQYFGEEAAKKGLGLIWYEGGTHFDSDRDPDITRFLKDVAQHPRMYALYVKLFQGWKEVGGTQIHMWGGIGKDSVWTFKHRLEDTKHPKWRAMMDFARENPCWWDGCDENLSRSQARASDLEKNGKSIDGK